MFMTGRLNDLLGVAFAERHGGGPVRYVLFHPGTTATSYAGEFDPRTAAYLEQQRMMAKPASAAAARRSADATVDRVQPAHRAECAHRTVLGKGRGTSVPPHRRTARRGGRAMSGAVAACGRIDKRQAILNVAFTVFARQGYAQAGVDVIAAEAGVAKATVYSHFGDKENLLREAIAASTDQTLAASVPATSPAPNCAPSHALRSTHSSRHSPRSRSKPRSDGVPSVPVPYPFAKSVAHFDAQSSNTRWESIGLAATDAAWNT
jgi:hypothetical protein